MLHRFWTYEQAALFASMKRDEGCLAEVLHENAGSFWGPLPVGGVAVWVSEEAAEENDEVPDLGLKGPELPWLFSLMGMMLMVSVPMLSIIVFVLALLRHALDYPGEAAGLVCYIVLRGFAFLLLALLAYAVAGFCLSRWLHALWDPMHPRHASAKGLHFIMAVILLLACTPVGMILVGSIVGFN